ncbi:MAG: hypothetical protein RR550_02300, partial [Rikenellaceae bacterium]
YDTRVLFNQIIKTTMKNKTNREIYENYFIDRLFYYIQCNPSNEYISFEYIQGRAYLATDIYLTFRSKNKSPFYSLEKAFVVLFRDFDTKDFNPFG